MMKKMIYQMLSVCFLLGILVSCSPENGSGDVSPITGISLELRTSAQTHSSVDPGTDEERLIESVSVWFFSEGATDSNKALYQTTVSKKNSEGTLLLNFTDKELSEHGMSIEGVYEVFVVANLPEPATIDGQTSLAALKEYVYTDTDRPKSPFCMAGSSNGPHDFAMRSQVTIPLLRVASRLDIKVVNETGKDWQINKISIEEDQQSVLLFSPAAETVRQSDVFATANTIWDASTSDKEVTCPAAYIYENLSSNAVKVKIEGSVSGTDMTWTAELMPPGESDTSLPRNTIYGVTLKLKDKVANSVNIAYTIN